MSDTNAPCPPITPPCPNADEAGRAAAVLATVERALSCSYDTMGFGTDPGYSDTRSGRMQSVYESTLGSLYK